MNADATKVQFGDVERDLGGLTRAEIETLLRSWTRKNHDTSRMKEGMLLANESWFRALCERIEGRSGTFVAMLDEANETAHRWAAARWKDTSMLEARLEELSGLKEPLFEDEA